MLPIGITGKLDGVTCKTTPHIRQHMGSMTVQLLQFDVFTGWNWSGVSFPITTALYNLDPSKYYHWYNIFNTDFVPDSELIPDTIRSGRADTVRAQGCNCIQCNDRNDWAEPNMTNNRFMCHGCRSTDRWRYQGEFL